MDTAYIVLKPRNKKHGYTCGPTTAYAGGGKWSTRYNRCALFCEILSARTVADATPSASIWKVTLDEFGDITSSKLVEFANPTPPAHIIPNNVDLLPWKRPKVKTKAFVILRGTGDLDFYAGDGKWTKRFDRCLLFNTKEAARKVQKRDAYTGSIWKVHLDADGKVVGAQPTVNYADFR